MLSARSPTVDRAHSDLRSTIPTRSRTRRGWYRPHPGLENVPSQWEWRKSALIFEGSKPPILENAIPRSLSIVCNSSGKWRHTKLTRHPDCFNASASVRHRKKCPVAMRLDASTRKAMFISAWCAPTAPEIPGLGSSDGFPMPASLARKERPGLRPDRRIVPARSPSLKSKSRALAYGSKGSKHCLYTGCS